MIEVNCIAISLSWFTYSIIEYKSKGPFYLITAVFCIFFVLDIILWNNELTVHFHEIITIPLNFFNIYRSATYIGESGIITTVEYILLVAVLLFSFTIVLRHKSPLRPAHERSMRFFLILFFIAALNDIALAFGLYVFIFLTEYAFFAMIISMGFLIINNFIDLHNELDSMNINLERKVAERTKELSETRDKLYEDLAWAKKAEFALLPQKIPRLESCDIAYKYLPMLEVGGDFVDIHCNETTGEIGLFICDVSGHGVSAAMIASMVKISLSSWSSFLDKPADHLRHIKKTLAGKLGEKFITAQIVYLDCETGRILHANAGHPPMILVRQNGAVDEIQTEGKMISDFFIEECGEKELFLEEGDILILYTDSVTDARRADGKQLDAESLWNLAAESRLLSAQKICDRIYDHVIGYTGSELLNDDLSILIAKYRPGKKN